MKLQFGVLLLILGSILILLGALLKLESWGLANEMLSLGILLEVTGVLLLVYKAVSKRKRKTLE
jgi:hypothetical protein